MTPDGVFLEAISVLRFCYQAHDINYKWTRMRRTDNRLQGLRSYRFSKNKHSTIIDWDQFCYFVTQRLPSQPGSVFLRDEFGWDLFSRSVKDVVLKVAPSLPSLGPSSFWPIAREPDSIDSPTSLQTVLLSPPTSVSLSNVESSSSTFSDCEPQQVAESSVAAPFSRLPFRSMPYGGTDLENTCRVDSTLTTLYMLINGRQDLRRALQRALGPSPNEMTSETMRVLSESLSLMVDNEFEKAKRLWATHCRLTDPNDWWGDLVDVLFKPLSAHPFFRLQQTTTNTCNNSSCASPLTTDTITWLKMSNPETISLRSQFCELALGKTARAFCPFDSGVGIRTIATAVDSTASLFLLVEVPERLVRGFDAFPRDFRWPHPASGAQYDLGAVICCDSKHFVAYVSCPPDSFSDPPGPQQWFLCDGRKPVQSVANLELSRRSRFVPSAAIYVKRS